MLKLLTVLGICLLLPALARPAVTTTGRQKSTRPPVPTKYKACKANDCPPFTVIKKITRDIELRSYFHAWWVSAKTQATTINRSVTRLTYFRLRRYLATNNRQRRRIRMGVPVTKLIEPKQGTSKKDLVTMSFYLSDSYPPQPSERGVWLEFKSIEVYVKIFKGISFHTGITKSHAHNLGNALVKHGYDGTFFPPSVKYITAGYDSPFVPRQNRTNEVWLIKKP